MGLDILDHLQVYVSNHNFVNYYYLIILCDIMLYYYHIILEYCYTILLSHYIIVLSNMKIVRQTLQYFIIASFCIIFFRSHRTSLFEKIKNIHFCKNGSVPNHPVSTNAHNQNMY